MGYPLGVYFSGGAIALYIVFMLWLAVRKKNHVPRTDYIGGGLMEDIQQCIREFNEETTMSERKSSTERTAREFFESLTWDRLERQLEETLRDPGVNIPQVIHCPAIQDLFRRMAQHIGEQAIQKPGQVLTTETIFNLDQSLALARILESLVRLAEVGPVSSVERAIGESPIMKGLEKPYGR